jgi:predicted HicB family RNase H-like nuclease
MHSNKSRTPFNAVLNIRVDRELSDKIQLLANADKRSKNNMIRVLLEEAINARTKKSGMRA